MSMLRECSIVGCRTLTLGKLCASHEVPAVRYQRTTATTEQAGLLLQGGPRARRGDERSRNGRLVEAV